MDIKAFLNTVSRQIKYEPVRGAITEELENHMQEVKEEHMRCGMEEKEAEEKAVLQMGVPEEIGEKLNHVHRPRLDWKLFLLLLILIGFNLVVSFLKQGTDLGHTALYMLVGIGLGVGIYFFDYQKIKKYSLLIFVLASVLMILPRLGMGVLVNGTYNANFRWITFSPNLMALPLYIVAIIGYLAQYDANRVWKIQIQNETFYLKKDGLKIAGFMIGSLLLMFGMPSLVTGLILAFIYLILITIKIVQEGQNVTKKLMILYGMIGVLGILFVLANPFVLTRIFRSFHPENDPRGYGYTGMLRKEVLKNAKLVGEAQTRVISSDEYILTREDNYTFIYLVGKTGILVAGILVFVILLTALKMLINAKNIKEKYGKMLIIGLSSLYIVQSSISVLMNLNLGIETNVDLPLVTYGGVYFVINIVSFALILSIYRRKDIYLYEKTIDEKSSI